MGRVLCCLEIKSRLLFKSGSRRPTGSVSEGAVGREYRQLLAAGARKLAALLSNRRD